MKTLSNERMAKLEGGSCQSAAILLKLAKQSNSLLLYFLGVLVARLTCKGGIDTTT